jgi:hypothetical protein
MLEEWVSLFRSKKKINPNDEILYFIPNNIINLTEKYLKEYSKIQDGNEGLVYWAGIKKESQYIIRMVIIPKLITESQRVIVTPKANLELIRTLSNYSYTHLAQVHSHPGNWVDHSIGDDIYAAFKYRGLISIVVPNYCKDGMLPLINNGIHRHEKNSFIRLSSKYISKHFIIESNSDSKFVDLR